MTATREYAAVVEALTDGTPSTREYATVVEALVSGAPSVRAYAVVVEVLAPTVQARARWGVPITPTYG